jgi:hypothetical protein
MINLSTRYWYHPIGLVFSYLVTILGSFRGDVEPSNEYFTSVRPVFRPKQGTYAVMYRTKNKDSRNWSPRCKAIYQKGLGNAQLPSY